MNNEFQWDDKKVLAFAAKLLHDRVNWAVIHDLGAAPVPMQLSLQEFKESHTEGKGVEWEIISFSYTSGNATIIIPKLKNGLFHCGFEEVSESYCYKEEYNVHSVRRLSDNSVWTVGDDCFHGPIVRFNLRNDQITADFEYGDVGCSKLLSELSKPLQRTPLLITNDGVSLYNRNDKYWRVYDDWSIGLFEVSNVASYEVKASFASEDKANEYVILNKPCLSASDILAIWSLSGDARQRIIELAKQKLDKH